MDFVADNRGASGAAPDCSVDDGVGGLECTVVLASGTAILPERELQRRLQAFARRFLRDRTEAEDVMQEALLRARQGLPRLRSADRAEAWLFRICRHTAIDHRRARRVRERVWQPLTDECVERIAAAPASHRDHEHACHGGEAACALHALPAHHRVLMSLHYERGLPQGTICQLTGLSTSALRVRLFRARGALSAHSARSAQSRQSPRSAPVAARSIKRDLSAGR